MEDLAREYAKRIRMRLGPRVKEVILFGSRARGDAREYSDYDVLVVLDQRSPELRAEILDIGARMMDQYGILVATVLRSVEEWRGSQGYPFARNIARESIAL
jgi:predicted nucleotidyltransferase